SYPASACSPLSAARIGRPVHSKIQLCCRPFVIALSSRISLCVRPTCGSSTKICRSSSHATWRAPTATPGAGLRWTWSDPFDVATTKRCA
ncbi:Cse1, partial [Symbiodinium pilosum]